MFVCVGANTVRPLDLFSNRLNNGRILSVSANAVYTVFSAVLFDVTFAHCEDITVGVLEAEAELSCFIGVKLKLCALDFGCTGSLILDISSRSEIRNCGDSCLDSGYIRIDLAACCNDLAVSGFKAEAEALSGLLDDKFSHVDSTPF